MSISGDYQLLSFSRFYHSNDRDSEYTCTCTPHRGVQDTMHRHCDIFNLRLQSVLE